MNIPYKAAIYTIAPNESIRSIIRKLNMHTMEDATVEYFMEVFKTINKKAVYNVRDRIAVPIISEYWDEYLREFKPYDHIMDTARVSPNPLDKYRKPQD